MSATKLPPLEIDPSLSGKENLLILINRDNGTSASISDLSFAAPLDYDDPYDKNNRNTMVTVTGHPTSEYAGSYTFKYWRKSLDRFAKEYVVDLDQVEASGHPVATIDDIHAYVCTELGLIADDVYIDALEMPVFDWENPVHEVFMTARLGSYVYSNSLKIVLVRDGRTDLGDIFGPGEVVDGIVIDPDSGVVIL